MLYKGVTRIITICVSKVGKALKTGQSYAIDVCPEQAEVLTGDRVVWQVQNAPRGVKVTVGNFKRIDQPPHILVRANKPPITREMTIQPQKPSGLVYKARTTHIGYYKYDILFDGHTVLDPDLEIKGPKR